MTPGVRWKSLGPRQRSLLSRARRGAIQAVPPADRTAALRLHDHGLLGRGRRAGDYHITNLGKEIHDAREKHG